MSNTLIYVNIAVSMLLLALAQSTADPKGQFMLEKNQFVGHAVQPRQTL